MTEEAATKVANTKQMVALAKAFNQSKSKVASINGEIGERIAKAVENGNLHAKAFKFNCGLARMFEKAGLFGEQHVGDIDELARRAEQEARDAEAGQVAENVHRLETGIKPLLEEDERNSGMPFSGRPSHVARETTDGAPLSEEDRAFDDDTSGKPSRRGRKGVGEEPGSYKVH